ncbi:phosphoribosyltransferase [uncultured Sphaerochaeta sp.]|uniref:phosphoribosyltransferase n=1 Tax=uncultured Sphaerochaeta sp. TaxID=886478 RepID=UPI0029CA68E1|nr:phosphoribosyltransferase [uncultured Sphaerochaeta sp.]
MDDNKFYVSYNSVHKLVKKLSKELIESGYDPDVIVAIGSGGYIPARIIKTFINRPIYAVGISYYGIDKKHKDHPTKIQWIDEVQSQLVGKKVLLIDEVDDTRATLAYCIGELLKYKPEEIAVLVLHNKNKEKDVEFPVEIKRYFAGLNLDDVWIKYPWDADDIDSHTEKEHQMLDHLKKEGKELYQ